MKKCPFCAEEIQDEAVYCRYCQKDLPDGEPDLDESSSRQKKSGWFGRLVAALIIILIIAALTLALKNGIDNLVPSWTQKAYIMPSILYGLGSEMISDTDGATLVYVPEGEFLMGFEHGDEAEKPAHKVWLDSFWIDKTEVTNAMFGRFVNETGYQPEVWLQGEGLTWRSPRGAGSDIAGLDDHPVVQIGWQDADAYCRWAGRRLPTEAEWEKAAIGWPQNAPYMNPRNFVYPWGDEDPAGYLLNFADVNSDNIENAATHIDDGYRYTAPVGSYPDGISPYMALDMAGNALEWTADWFDPAYYQNSPDRNPTGPEEGRVHVLKGGSWNDNEWDVRPFQRFEFDPGGLAGATGFRCAQDADEENLTCVDCNLTEAWDEFIFKLKCIWRRIREE